MGRPSNYDNILPASADPQGDPADADQGILPASMDPLGDPADQADAAQGIRPASEDPYGDPGLHDMVNQLPAEHHEEMAGGLLGALQGRGLDLAQLGSMLGLSSILPQQMGAQDLSRLLGWAQQNHPDAVQEATGGQSLLQNPLVSGILSNLAGKFLGR